MDTQFFINKMNKGSEDIEFYFNVENEFKEWLFTKYGLNAHPEKEKIYNEIQTFSFAITTISPDFTQII